MPWLKLLHIGAVVVWSGALLYLPTMIAAAASGRPGAHGLEPAWRSLPRHVFNGLATPAALLAIASGTLILVVHGPLAPWLMLKLAGVGVLALGHGACGVLLLRVERARHGGVRAACRAVTALTVLCLLGIAWLVLRKPA